jgi:hypothetical protein
MSQYQSLSPIIGSTMKLKRQHENGKNSFFIKKEKKVVAVESCLTLLEKKGNNESSLLKNKRK